MSPRSIGLSQPLNDYLTARTSPPDDVQRSLIERTAALGDVAGMQIAPEQGELLASLTALLAPSFVVEVGTFTGYSALAIARELVDPARLLCCDVSAEWTDIAREHWRAATVEHRIDLRLAPAIETLRALPEDGPLIDLAFVDADKGGYVDYYEELMRRLAPGGVVLVDNTLWSGDVVDTDGGDASGVPSDDTAAIRAFNDHVAADQRTRQVIIPIGDGLTLIRRAPG
ncbi:O-methyltransferase [Ilumatobacter sp.]|uniref:O-methyltransferase n=1 Tax=Ilumatobacter sp. TaxID=1967498 RepID=UPI003B529EAC